MSNRQKPSHAYSNGSVFVDGSLVSARHQRLVQAIMEYCDELEVLWVAPENRMPGQAAFKIIHCAPQNNYEPYTMFHVQNDEDFDERVLARIIANDEYTGKRKTSLGDEMAAYEEAQGRLEHQKFLDMMEERNDIAAHLLKTRKQVYKVNDDLIVDASIPVNMAHRK